MKSSIKKKRSTKNRIIVGIDEVGRGPLAGPVTLCACAILHTGDGHDSKKLFSKRGEFFGIRDSKKLSPTAREYFFEIARRAKNEDRIIFTLSHVSAGVIDKRGISKAVALGIERCLKKLAAAYDKHNQSNRSILFLPADCRVLLDGSLRAPAEFVNQKTIIRGDDKIPLISLASVIAKVTRDRKMVRLARKFPGYGLEIHKGYGTALHRKNIEKQGLSDLHRRSFCRRYSYLQTYLH